MLPLPGYGLEVQLRTVIRNLTLFLLAQEGRVAAHASQAILE